MDTRTPASRFEQPGSDAKQHDSTEFQSKCPNRACEHFLGLHSENPLTSGEDPRTQLQRAFPNWMQPTITWISGKTLSGQQPLMPILCTPLGKVCVAILTVGLGVALCTDAMSLFA